MADLEKEHFPNAPPHVRNRLNDILQRFVGSDAKALLGHIRRGATILGQNLGDSKFIAQRQEDFERI